MHYDHGMDTPFNARLMGSRLLLCRRDLGLNQDDVADIAGISRSRISDIERGDGAGTAISSIFSLATALGVSVEYLLGLTDDPLGEGEEKVLKEMNPDYVVFEVDNLRMRSDIQRLVDAWVELDNDQRSLVLILVDQLRRALRPRIIGAEEEVAK